MDGFMAGVGQLPKTTAQLNRERDLKLVEESWVKCSVLGTKKENIGTIMYDAILRAMPDFYSNKRRGRTLLAQSFEAMVSMVVAYSENPRKLEVEERVLFIRHAHYNMSHELVSAMRQALLLALEQLLAEEWNPQLEIAWTQVWDETSAVIIEHTSQIQQFVECIQDDWDDALALGLPAMAAKLQANLMVEMMNKSGPKSHGSSLFGAGAGGTKDFNDVTHTVAHHFATKNGGEFFSFDGTTRDHDGGGNTMSSTMLFQQHQKQQAAAAQQAETMPSNGVGLNTTTGSLGGTLGGAGGSGSGDLASTNKQALAMDVTDLLVTLVHQVTQVEDMTGLTSNLDLDLRKIFHRNGKVPDLRRVAAVAFSTIKEVSAHRWNANHDAAWSWLWSFAILSKEAEWSRDLADRVVQGWHIISSTIRAQLDIELAHTKLPQDFYVEREESFTEGGKSGAAPKKKAHVPPTDGTLMVLPQSVPMPSMGGFGGGALPTPPNGNPVVGSAAAKRLAWAKIQSSAQFTAQKKKKEFTIEDVPDSSDEDSDHQDGEQAFTDIGAPRTGSGHHRDAGKGHSSSRRGHSSGPHSPGGEGTSDSPRPNIAQKRVKGLLGPDSSSAANPSASRRSPSASSSRRGLKRDTPRVPARIAYRIGTHFYQEIFKKAPTLRRVFVRPAHNYGILFKAIFGMMMRHVHNPGAMWDDQQELALRHVNFGMRPSDVPLFGKIFLQCLEEIAGANWSPIHHSAWSIFWEIGSFGLNAVVIAGSHPATRALILGDRSELLVALREASRAQRVQWSCMVELRGKQRSPLEWAIKDGKLKMAELLLREALTLRVDPSNTFYYGADLLWAHHDNLIPFLADMVPQLLPVLLDGLFWTSSQVLDGHRRVVIFGHPLWGDPRHPASGDSVFETPLAVLVKGTYLGSDELFLHPVLDILCEIKWRLFAKKSYLVSTCIPVVLQFLLFICGFIYIDFIPHQVQSIARILAWAVSLLLAARILYRAATQLRAGHVQPHLPFGLTLNTKKAMVTSPIRNPDLNRARAVNAYHSAAHSPTATETPPQDPISKQGMSAPKTPIRTTSNNGSGQSATASGSSGPRQPPATPSSDGKRLGGTAPQPQTDGKPMTTFGAKATPEGRGIFRVGVPWALRDLGAWMQLLLALLLTVAIVSELTRSPTLLDSDFLTSSHRQLEWNICVALSNLCIWHSLTALSLLWSPARATVAVVGVLLSSLAFFMTLLIAFAGAFYKSGLLPEFEGFGAVTATLFFLSQGAFEMQLPSGQDLDGDDGAAVVIYNTFLEILAPIFQLVGGLMLTTLLMADLTAQFQCILEESKLDDEERILHTESLPFTAPVVFDDTPSHLTGALSLMMSVNHPGLEFAFDRLERFTSDLNTGPDAPWPRQAAEGDAKIEFELATEKQLKHLISTANRVQRLLTLQTQNIPTGPPKADNDGESVAGRSSVATHFTNRTGFSIPGF